MAVRSRRRAGRRRRRRRRPAGLRSTVDWELIGGAVIAAAVFLAFVVLLLVSADTGGQAPSR